MVTPEVMREPDLAQIESEIEREIDQQLTSTEARDGRVHVEVCCRGTDADFRRVLKKYRRSGWKVEAGYFAQTAWFEKPKPSWFDRLVSWFIAESKT